MFCRGGFHIRGKFPYGKRLVPPLPNLTQKGDNRVGMHYLAGLCPRHAIEFESRLLNVLIHGDSIRSDDDSADPAITHEDIVSSSSLDENSHTLLPIKSNKKRSAPPRNLLQPSPPLMQNLHLNRLLKVDAQLHRVPPPRNLPQRQA